MKAMGTRSTWSSYPTIWKASAKAFSEKYSNVVTANTTPAKTLFLNRTILEFVYNFYKNIKLAMPSLLGYRFQNQIMSQYTNKSGRSVIDYEDEENSVVMKSLPIMDVS